MKATSLCFIQRMEQAKHGDTSGNNTIFSLDDFAPNLAPDLFIAPAIESIIPTTISWQLGYYLVLSETWILEIWGYYLCPM